MTASSAAGVTRAWVVRLLLVSAGAVAAVALSAGTADAGTHLVGDVVKEARSVVKSTEKVVHRAPVQAPVRHTVSTVAKAGRQVAIPVKRVSTPRNSSSVRPATPVQRIAKATPKRVVHQVPVVKVVHLAVKPLPVKTPAVKTLAVKTPAVKTLAVEVSIIATAPLITTVDRELVGPVASSVLKPVVTSAPLQPVLAPVAPVVTPVLNAVPVVVAPVLSAPVPILPAPVFPIASGLSRSVFGVAPGMSTAATPGSDGPTPIVSGVGSTSSRQTLAAVAHTTVTYTVLHAVDRVGDGTGSLVLGGLGSVVIALAVGVGGTGTASAGSGAAAGFAVLEGGLLGAAATFGRRVRDGLRIASWAFAKHPGFAPD